jgi:hypothetical protein
MKPRRFILLPWRWSSAVMSASWVPDSPESCPRCRTFPPVARGSAAWFSGKFSSGKITRRGARLCAAPGLPSHPGEHGATRQFDGFGGGITAQGGRNWLIEEMRIIGCSKGGLAFKPSGQRRCWKMASAAAGSVLDFLSACCGHLTPEAFEKLAGGGA